MLQILAPYQFPALVLISTLVLSFVLTRVVLGLALRFDWATASNERSSHVGRLAFGGGASVIFVSLGAWLFLTFPQTQIQIAVLISVLALAIVSWLDDLNNLPSGLRMMVQFAGVATCLFLLPSQQTILPFDWPIYVDRIIAGFFWLWFINLFNFMDGIDGLAGVETVSVALGVFFIGSMSFLAPEWSILALAIAGATLGFLPWNWHRARIMLGDLGAIPLGFLLGFLLIQLSLQGNWVAALILPGYFVVDATTTFIRRAIKREKVLQAHRTHFYQRASSPTEGHDAVVVRVAIANVGLIAAGLLSISQPVLGALLAIIILATLIIFLIRLAKTKP